MFKHLESDLLAKGFKTTVFTFILAGVFILALTTHGDAAEPPASNPAFQVATIDKMTDSQVQWVAAGGGVLAYGAGEHVSFALVNEPFTPVSQLTFEGVISEALILGKLALLSQDDLGLRMIDLSMPSDPVDLGLYPLSGAVSHLASWGNLLFVSGVEPGIQIYEISLSDMQNPPFNLSERGTIPVAGSITALAAWDWKIYASTGNEIEVYDLSDPSSPLEIGSIPITLPVRAMAISGDSLFIAAGDEGLHIIDLSAPVTAESVATHPIQSESLYAAGRLIYVAAGHGGLQLLNAGPIATATFDVQVAPGGSLTFSPDPVNVNVGDTVHWVWMASGHSTTSGNTSTCTPNGTWDSGVHNQPFTFDFTFNTAGSNPYFCSVHCAFGMKGTVNVAGAGQVINMSITPDSVNYGNVNVGSNSDQMITITNEASSTAALTGTVGTPADPFSVVMGGGAFSLAPGQSLTVTIRFSPTAAGAVSVNLSITNNSTNHPNSISVSLMGTGIGQNVPAISVTPTSQDFGTVKVKKSKKASFRVTNSGKGNLTITSTITGPDALMFTIPGASGNKTIKPGKSITIKVTFKPTSAGSMSATLEITSNDPNNPTIDISLIGTGQ